MLIYVSIVEVHLRLNRQLQRENGNLEKQRVKVSGDGVKMSRIANFIVISFALLSDGEKVMSCKGNHTVGIVSGSEDYDVLKVSCKDLFAEINELVDEGEIEVDGHKIPLDFYLSGDYKLKLTNYVNSNSWDTSKPENYYWMDGNKRTLADNKELAKKSSNNCGCIRSPLLNIPIENIRVDELHLLLRVTDRLEKNIQNDAIEKDKKYNLNKAPSARKYTNMQKTIEAINNCGVSLSVWDKRNADGTPSGLYDWTSMVGNEKKKVLRSLPEKFPQILDPEHCNTISKILKATEWIKLYLSLGGDVIGYENASVTPYFHILTYHLTRFIRDETAFKSFTGQGVKEINDTVRSIYHNKCNKHDACKEAILALKRIDHLQASGKIKEDEKVQCAILLQVIGEKALELYNTFMFAAGEDPNKISDLKKKFEEYVNPRKNTVFERYRFWECKQQEGERQLITYRRAENTCKVL
ncbi:hypothetical protein ACROYT_G015133 [Oculina patagonica]